MSLQETNWTVSPLRLIKKMAGDAQGVDDAEERMFVRVDLVSKQIFYRPRVVLKRREGNIMEDNQ